MNLIKKIQGITKASVKTICRSSLLAVTAVSVVAVPALAAPDTGNTDLDTLITSMESGLGNIKTGGLYIVAAIIVIAVVFLGARWLWNMFRSWLAKAQ